jgi:hypothetical protein
MGRSNADARNMLALPPKTHSPLSPHACIAIYHRLTDAPPTSTLDMFLQPPSTRVSSHHEMACRIIAFDPFSSPALSMRSISARISLRFSRSDFASSYLRCTLASCTKLSRRASCSNNGWSICARAASRSATSLASSIDVPFLDGDAVAGGLGRDCSSNVRYDVRFVRWYVRFVCIIY